ncbi:LPO_1073/Vpar_1526 family protein [Vibrio harveyi]|uniref:LPO_1073/Vpar_1526 family protein n=1 Tax=Vibrio harveyi TaxID=669 RepID=UPI0025B137FA|nr:LPO_1073/Vpar_1526 family protein [Vibrio harveyi]WJT07248.1 hypothetical protein PH545_00225 [Vibrio harveyi]
MLSKDQNQELGQGSVGLQAGGDIHYGVTATEARAIALDVAKVTFYELTGTAKELATVRVEQITDKVIEKLKQDYPEGLQKAIDPDFQYALHTVQKEYARNGDEDLADLLVDLLVDRSKQDYRNLEQIVLNESLATAPKLTNSQLSSLAIIFLFRYTQNNHVLDHESLKQYLNNNVKPFSNSLATSQASFQHLTFAGCGSSELQEFTLEGILNTTYQGVFLKGNTQEEIESEGINVGKYKSYFISCLNDPTKLQVNAINVESLNKRFEMDQIDQDTRTIILNIFNNSKFNDDETKNLCLKLAPYMSAVFDAWNTSGMSAFSLTSVGIAIGHSNVKRVAGKFSDLSIWVN